MNMVFNWWKKSEAVWAERTSKEWRLETMIKSDEL